MIFKWLFGYSKPRKSLRSFPTILYELDGGHGQIESYWPFHTVPWCRQAEMWHEAIVSNAPSERYSHSAVLDVEQRMWIFGGKGRDDSDSSSLKLSDFAHLSRS